MPLLFKYEESMRSKGFTTHSEKLEGIKQPGQCPVEPWKQQPGQRPAEKIDPVQAARRAHTSPRTSHPNPFLGLQEQSARARLYSTGQHFSASFSSSSYTATTAAAAAAAAAAPAPAAAAGTPSFCYDYHEVTIGVTHFKKEFRHVQA